MYQPTKHNYLSPYGLQQSADYQPGQERKARSSRHSRSSRSDYGQSQIITGNNRIEGNIAGKNTEIQLHLRPVASEKAAKQSTLYKNYKFEHKVSLGQSHNSYQRHKNQYKNSQPKHKYQQATVMSASHIEDKMSSSHQEYTFGRNDADIRNSHGKAFRIEQIGQRDTQSTNNNENQTANRKAAFIPKHMKVRKVDSEQQRLPIHMTDQHHKRASYEQHKSEKFIPSNSDYKKAQTTKQYDFEKWNHPSKYNPQQNQFKASKDYESSTNGKAHDKEVSTRFPPRPPTNYESNNQPSKRNNDPTQKHQKRSQKSDASYSKRSQKNLNPPPNTNLKRRQGGLNLNDFQIGKKLGKGAYGSVYMVREKETKTLFALKKMNKKLLRQAQNEENIFRQLKIHLYMNHPNVVKLYGIFCDEENIFLLMEYMNEGSLHGILEKKQTYSERKAAVAVRQIADAIQYIHEEHVIHRDLKLQNIISTNSVLKLGDFGCAVHTFNLRDTKIGSLAYHSPQQLLIGTYDEKVDIWGLGIITFQLLFGVTPFDEDIIKIVNKEPNAKLSQLKFPTTVPISNEAKDFIKRLLQKHPNRRMSIQAVRDHPFITKNYKEDIEKIQL